MSTTDELVANNEAYVAQFDKGDLPLPPGRTVLVPGRGEFFLRDTGGDGPPVLLVHGWMFPSDLNWLQSYRPLRDAPRIAPLISAAIKEVFQDGSVTSLFDGRA